MKFVVIKRNRIDDEEGELCMVTFQIYSKRKEDDARWVQSNPVEVFIDPKDAEKYVPGTEFELALNVIQPGSAN